MHPSRCSTPLTRLTAFLLPVLSICLWIGTLQAQARVPLLSSGATWHYLDTATNPATNWFMPGFDDRSWKTGPSRLGYGGDGETTTLGYGSDPNNKFITAWFRTTFNVTEPKAFTDLNLNLLRDDGAVVYLNGTEIRRDNLPTGPISATTLATATVGNADEQTFFPTTHPATLLVTGTNVIAVEVHQSVVTSSDLSLDATLDAGILLPSIRLLTPTNGTITLPNSAIILAAEVTAPSAPIVQLTFLDGTNLLARFTNASLPTFVWTNPPPGSHSLRATVLDSLGNTADSSIATVTVPGSTPLRLLSAYAASPSKVIAQFSADLSPDTATNLNHFLITPTTTLQSATLASNPRQVLLATQPLTENQTYTLSVTRLTDIFNNHLAPDPQTAPLLLSRFSLTNIGTPSLTGSLTTQGTTLNLLASTGDFANTSDQGLLAAETRTGNFDVRLRVLSMSDSDAWAKAGLMAREDGSPTSRFAAAFSNPGLLGGFFAARTSTSGKVAQNGSFPWNHPNTWLRLRREGDSFTGYAGIDGTHWTVLGSAQIPLPATLLVGPAGASRNPTTLLSVRMEAYGDSPIPETDSTAFAPPFEPRGPSSRKTGLVITEIMHSPAPRTDGRQLEFIELYNSTPFPDDLSGYQLSGDIEFTFPANTTLAGGACLVVARNPADLQTQYGITNVFGPWSGKLSPSGNLRLLSKAGAVFLEIQYRNQNPWPAGVDGTGHSLFLARPSYGENDPHAWTRSLRTGGTPGTGESWMPDPLQNIVINEFLAHTDDPELDYIELYNHGNTPVDLGNCTLSDHPHTNRFRLPPSTVIPPRGFLSFNQTQLGFSLSAGGETIYFKNPNATRVIDAVRYTAQENGVSTGRVPDGGDEFYRLASKSAGKPNGPIRLHDLVINELMYNPISGDANDQYIEIHNAGTNIWNLTGWRLTGGASFSFNPGQEIHPGAYLVIAKSPGNLLGRYPHLNATNTTGPFSGSLSSRGERLALEFPDDLVSTNSAGNLVTNRLHVAVDEVTYGTGGRWGKWARGGGSSLELLNPRSNHRLASNWADSDESNKAPWTLIEHTDFLNYGAGTADSLQILLQGEGECLIDNIEVIGPGNTNRLTNSNFETSLSPWVVQGSHIQSTLETNGGFNSSQSLHIRASDRGDTGANRIFSRFTPALPTTGTNLITLRARARWIAGWPELLLRLRGNYLEAEGRLTLPTNPGTPGLPNSRHTPNPGPAIHAVHHNPTLPAANQSVTITCIPDDPDGTKTLTLHYRIDPATTDLTTSFNDDGTEGDAVAGDGIFTATLPGQPTGTLAAFWIEATDNPGTTSRFPGNAPAREAYIRFGESSPTTTFGVYRQWFPSKTVTAWTQRPTLSNERLDGTFVYGDFRAIYNFGSRYAGSPYHQGFNPPSSDGHYSIEFPLDDLLLGTENFNKVHGPGNSPFDDDTIQREQTAFWLVRQLGLPWLNRRYVVMYFNGTRRRTLMEDSQVPGSDMISEYFPTDDTGYLHKLQPWFEFDNANTVSLGFANYFWCNLYAWTDSKGAFNKPSYRWNFLARAVKGSANDYSAVYNLIRAANTPDYSGPNTSFVTAMDNVADIEQWMRTFAVEHAVGNWDSVGAQNSQNMYGYKPDHGRWNLLIWDYNIVLGNSGSWGAGTELFTVGGAGEPMQHLFATPIYRRAYWRALKDLCTGPMLPDKFGPVIDNRYAIFQAEGLSVAAPNSIRSYINNARTSILKQMAAEETNRFGLTSPATTNTTATSITLTGVAPMEVASILVNNTPWTPTWTSTKTWSLTLPLSTRNNTFSLSPLDRTGNPLPLLATTTAKVTTSASPELPQDRILISEILHSPTTPGSEFVELYNASVTTPFNLSNWEFKGLNFTFPPATILPPKTYLLIARDPAIFHTRFPAVTNQVLGPFNGKLNPDGDTLELRQPDATGTNVTTIAALHYLNAPPWPVIRPASDLSLQLIDLNKDPRRPLNWSASPTTPGIRNSVNASLFGFEPVWINEVEPEPGTSTGWIELSNPTDTAADLSNHFLSTTPTNLAMWAFPTNTSIPAHGFLRILADNHPELTTPTQPHAAFLLQPGEGSVTLSRANPASGKPEPLDHLPYHHVRPGRSYGDYPDSNPVSRQEFLTPTPGAPNSPASPPTPVFFNEWMAKNTSFLADPADNNFDDWFELYNAGANTADLSGYILETASSPNTASTLPEGTKIPAKGFLLIFADGQPGQNRADRPDIHVQFKLSAAGSTLRLLAPDNSLVDSVSFTNQTSNLSEGRLTDGGPTIGRLAIPTPRTPNIAPGPNTPPSLTALPPRTLAPGATLVLTLEATDPDRPPQTLRYTLTSASATGATVDPVSGLFTWTAPATATRPLTNQFVLTVTDDGIPPMASSQKLTVLTLPVPRIQAQLTPDNTLELTWTSQPGQSYLVEYKASLSLPAWAPLSNPIPASSTETRVTLDTRAGPQGYYRITRLD